MPDDVRLLIFSHLLRSTASYTRLSESWPVNPLKDFFIHTQINECDCEGKGREQRVKPGDIIRRTQPGADPNTAN